MSLLAQLATLLGPSGLLTDPSDTAPYCSDWRGLFHGRTAAVLRPADTAQLADAVRLCAEAGAKLVPMGGNTSMVGGASVSDDGSELVLSLSRLNRIRAIDPIDMTMTVEAGVTLKAAQDAAADAGCLLPLSISSEGSATIGGVLATNAGGNNTVRYGNARELTLGIEAVLPDGTVFAGLRRLRKDNTGYALRQLLVGSEGTLGIISCAVLQLHPRPRQIEVALCALPTVEAALSLFMAFRAADPSAIQAFEYMSGAGMALVNALIPDAALPLAEPASHYVLVELATARDDGTLRTLLESVLGTALEDGSVLDAVIAESRTQRLSIWKLREEHAEAQKRAGGSVKNDVSVPVSKVPDLIARATAACETLIPGIRAAPFGHLGDGNIHFNLVQPANADRGAFLARDHEIMDTVCAIVRDLDGSFSAEHGVGRLKPYMMPDWRGGAELETMRRIKQAIDPCGMLNPGKVFPRGFFDDPSDYWTARHLARACNELGLAIEFDYRVRTGSGREVQAVVRIPALGGPQGMLVVTDYDSIREAASELFDEGFGYSTLGEWRSDEPFDLEGCRTMFSDWGWGNPTLPKPDWLHKWQVFSRPGPSFRRLR